MRTHFAFQAESSVADAIGDAADSNAIEPVLATNNVLKRLVV